MIRHQWLSLHNYSIVALPWDEFLKLPVSFSLIQNDGSSINVTSVDYWKFTADMLPENLTLCMFGITHETLLKRLHTRFAYLSGVPAKDQIIAYLLVKKITE